MLFSTDIISRPLLMRLLADLSSIHQIMEIGDQVDVDFSVLIWRWTFLEHRIPVFFEKCAGALGAGVVLVLKWVIYRGIIELRPLAEKWVIFNVTLCHVD